MFGATVFDFWGTHDNWPMLGGPECQLAFVLEYVRRQREQYCSIFIHDDHSEQDDNEMPIRFAKMIKRRKEIDASAKKSKPRPKRQKKNCLFDIALRRVEDGAESVQVICSGDEFDNMEHKVVALLEAVLSHDHVCSLELQVCAHWPPTKLARADFCFVFSREMPLGPCLRPLKPL